jgi:hypothetical protein
VFELSGSPRQVDLNTRIFNRLNNHPSKGSFMMWFSRVVEAEGMWAVTIMLKLWGKIDHIFGNLWPRNQGCPPPMTLLNLMLARTGDGRLRTNGLMVRCLINAGANVELISVQNYERRFGGPLHLAAKHGLDNTIQLLIAAGANINKLCSAHQTPLTWAIRYSKRDAVLLLLRGAPGAREKKNMLKLAIGTEREALIKTGWKETAGQYGGMSNEQYLEAVEIIEIIRAL